MSLPIREAAALAGRLLLAAIFLHEAYAKLTGYAAAVAYARRSACRASSCRSPSRSSSGADF